MTVLQACVLLIDTSTPPFTIVLAFIYHVIIWPHPQIISHLCGQHSYNESGPIYAAFKNGSLAAALGHMAEHKMSSSVVLALYELCVAKNTRDYSGMCL